MSIRIKHGSWQRLLPVIHNNSIDLVYTDPPYGMNYTSGIPGHRNWNKSGESNSKFDKVIDGDDPTSHGSMDWQIFWNHCYRVLKDDRYLITHGNFSFLATQYPMILKAGFTEKGVLSWRKQFAVGGDLEGSAKRDWEQILYVAKGKPKTNPINTLRGLRKRVSESEDWVFQLKKKERQGHPTQKPVALGRQLVAWACPPNGVVLDPFCGSGTSMLAAKFEKRDGIGFEVYEAFYKIAKNRCL